MSKHAAPMLILILLMPLLIIPAEPVSATFQDSWTSKAPLQVARGALGVAEVNGKIYAIGGTPEDVRMATTKQFLGTNEEYDPETNRWTMKKEMPTPRAALATAVYQGKVYCIGGKTSNGYTGVNEVYDPKTDTWETKASMPTDRGFLSASVVNGKIYLIGGSPPSVWNVTEVYDPETDLWVTKAAMPAVGEPASAVFNGKIYKMGARLQIYDPEMDAWSEGTSDPSDIGVVYGTGVTTAVFAPERVYAIGDRVGVYNPENDSWTVGAEKPADQKDFSVAVIGDLLYVVGGYTYDSSYAVYGVGFFQPLALNEQYTPFGYTEPEPTSSPTPTLTSAPTPAQILPILAVAVASVVLAGVGLLLIRKRVRGKTQ
jgi:N-acetylneuraminic acid mutarotase